MKEGLQPGIGGVHGDRQEKVRPYGAGFIISILSVGLLRRTHGYPEVAPTGLKRCVLDPVGVVSW